MFLSIKFCWRVERERKETPQQGKNLAEDGIKTDIDFVEQVLGSIPFLNFFPYCDKSVNITNYGFQHFYIFASWRPKCFNIVVKFKSAYMEWQFLMVHYKQLYKMYCYFIYN